MCGQEEKEFSVVCSRMLTLEFALFMPNVKRAPLILKILNNGYFVRDDGSIADEIKTDIKKYRKDFDNLKKWNKRSS